MGIDTIIGIVAVIVAVGFGILGIVLYRKAKKDSLKIKNELKDELTDKMVDVENASKRVGNGGRVAKRDDKIIAAHERNIQESHIPVSDSLSVKVRRWHDDSNGSDVVNGIRGYYTDE